MVQWTGKRIVKLSLFRQVNTAVVGSIGLEHVLFMCLYVVSLYYCYITIGEQHLEALSRAEAQNIDIFDDSEKLRNSAEKFFAGESVEEDPSTPGIRIPSKWLPGFWPSVSFGVICILHALMVLGQMWSVSFRCLIRFRKVDNVNDATHAHVTPQKHQGKEELVELQRVDNSTFMEFHRRKYIYDPKQDSFVKVRCRVNYPLRHFIRWGGIPSLDVCTQLRNLHGPNKFQMRTPAFMELYYAQITSPFTVFQIFCIVLWMLDDYWQYSLFTLFMICSFEATTVFSRLKSIGALKGMGNEPRPIFVHRCGEWREVSTEELLPGDLFSLTKHEKDDVIPCDALIVRGGAVVNESTLTGESVPQMKDGLASGSLGAVGIDDDSLDEEISIKGQHKVHALFGGTRVLQVTSVAARTAEFEEDLADEEEAAEEVEPPSCSEQGNCESVDPLSPPDGGCLCYCTRTGFSSSQGKLVRMIEHSTASVSGDTRDTVLLLLLLLVFALSASGYVLYKGMQDDSRSKYQLLLHCILIITSVIPPELPMQTALAVNASLMTLMKMQIFCTEPFRVPIAGKVDTCVFDKTGTLTTDELVAVGIVSPLVRVEHLRKLHEEAILAMEKSAREQTRTGPASKRGSDAPSSAPSVVSAATAGMTPISEAFPDATLVLGACHSVVLVDGKPAGDPLEVASLKAIKWEIPPVGKDCARPKPETMVERQVKVHTLDSGDVPITQVKILSRHHFSSKLQRMSVVARVKGDSGGAWALVKGSPDALSVMCVDCPPDYHKVAADLAKRGMRVIALGLRRLVSPEEIQNCCDSRASTETNLRFAGFVAFTCRVRKDTATCVQNLRKGGNAVIMATGDATLTAVHVAQEVGITSSSKKGILILEGKDTGFQWIDYDSGDVAGVVFSVESMPSVARDYDLCVTGATLNAVTEKFPGIAAHMDKFVVYARMRPDEKERVILAMKNHGNTVLMCGDGSNDVGALKQAHVGVALLSGFGDLNVSREKGTDEAAKKEGGADAKKHPVTALMTHQDFEELKRMRVQEIKTRLRQIGVEPDDFPDCVEKNDLIELYRKKSAAKAQENHDLKRQKELMKMNPKERQKFLAEERKALAIKQQEDFKKEYDELLAKGESWAMMKAMQNVWKRNMEEAKKKSKDNSLTGSAGRMAALMDEMEGMEDLETPMVKIGDASVASPFTSKMPSIKGTVDIIRQGRCTLVTTIQMYQILALNCLINAYSLSVLHLDGVKYGDRQMTSLGILMSVSFVTISRSKPLDQLSSVLPLKSVFHPALFFSLLGQFALHIGTMYFLVKECKSYLPEDHVVELDSEFKPNIVNSVVFLVTAVQQVSVFVVNLKGPPFMGGLVQNTPLLWSLVITFVGTFLLASESIPQLNSGLQLEPFPSVAFRNMVLLCLAVDVAGAFLWDRFLLGLLAFPVLKASLENTTRKEIMSIMRVVAIVCAALYYLASQDYTELLEEMERQEAAAKLAEGGSAAADSGSAGWMEYSASEGESASMFERTVSSVGKEL
mmetsp:Transcript_6291/g.9492  ORF Transcript_6291/g.9492 Transcript_6291/m.9492 type:complete len:1517 (+) Transcript_6291:72-4622(+)